MVSVLAITPKIRGFKPADNDGFLRAIKICNTPSFGGEVKPSSPCRKILRHVKNSTGMKEIFRRQNPSFPSPRSSQFATR
jgi:hypothetical protein